MIIYDILIYPMDVRVCSLDARAVSFLPYDYPMYAGADSRDAGGDSYGPI